MGFEVGPASSGGSATAVDATIVDAKGDLIVGTAADAVARKAVGTDDQILVADAASAGGVKWAARGGSYSPRHAAGRYTALTSATAPPTTRTATVNTPYALPFSLDKATSFDRIAIEVTTLNAGSTAKIGIYADSGGVPGALILDAGAAVDCSTNGVKEITIALTLQAGRYWAVVKTLGAQCTLRAQTTDLASWNSAATVTTYETSGLEGPVAAGALADPFGAVGNLSATVPRFAVRGA